MNEKSQNETLTVAQVAGQLGVSERTVRRRIERGELPASKRSSAQTGVAYFIEAAVLERFKNGETFAPLPENAPSPRGDEENFAALSAQIARLEASFEANLRAQLSEVLAPLFESIAQVERENERLRAQVEQLSAPASPVSPAPAKLRVFGGLLRVRREPSNP